MSPKPRAALSPLCSHEGERISSPVRCNRSGTLQDLYTTFHEMFMGTSATPGHTTAKDTVSLSAMVAGVSLYGIITRFCALVRRSPIREILRGIHGVIKPSCGQLTPPMSLQPKGQLVQSPGARGLGRARRWRPHTEFQRHV